MKKSLFWLLALVLSPVAVLVVITPMDSQKQYIFGLLSIGILFLMGFSKRRSVSVIMVVTSLLMSTRYMYFRLTQTLHFNSSIEAILGMGLFLAEVYIWVMLLLNYLQTVWPLKRGIVPLPDDMSKWPTVDIYIPSYNEPLEVVRDTVLAAQCIDYPKDKMKIYLLDDGKRSEFAVFAADVGVGYITRNDNKHAKAGNLNHALTLTQGELICVFDCDHVATRVFLQATVGGFLKDPMLALVQTPHYFYSPDPFERNLSVGRNMVVACLLALGVIVGIVRAIGHDYFGSDPNVIALNVGWGIYSLIFLLAAIAVARETRQVRKTIRIDVDIPVVIHYASGIVSRSHTADLSMGGCRVVAPDNRHLEDDIEEIELILQSGAISIPAQLVTSDERFLRLKFDEDIPLSRRRELVRVVLARADAWINPPRPQDNPFRSFFTILRCVFELFWLTWKTRRSQRNRATVAKTAQEDGTL